VRRGGCGGGGGGLPAWAIVLVQTLHYFWGVETKHNTLLYPLNTLKCCRQLALALRERLRHPHRTYVFTVGFGGSNDGDSKRLPGATSQLIERPADISPPPHPDRTARQKAQKRLGPRRVPVSTTGLAFLSPRPSHGAG
jgi:hypothetical protein